MTQKGFLWVPLMALTIPIILFSLLILNDNKSREFLETFPIVTTGAIMIALVSSFFIGYFGDKIMGLKDRLSKKGSGE